MILELGMILTALYAFTKKQGNKETVQAAPETSETKTEEKKETQPAVSTGLQSVFKESEENVFLNPAISKMIGIGTTLASQYVSGKGITGPGISGVLAVGLSGQSVYTQPYSGIAESVINSVFPVLGTVIGGFIEGVSILSKDDPQMTIPTGNFQFFRDYENMRIIQGLSKMVQNEPYKSMVEKEKKQIIEDLKKRGADITSISSLPYPSFIWSGYFPPDWDFSPSGNVIDMSVNNPKAWTEKNGFYFLNTAFFSALLNKYPYAKDTGISEDDFQSGNILWNVMGFLEEIKKDPAFGMIDPRSQILYNQWVAGQWWWPGEFGAQSYTTGIPVDVPVYRDDDGNMITFQSKQIWGKFQAELEILKKTKPQEYQQYIDRQEAFKNLGSYPSLS